MNAPIRTLVAACLAGATFVLAGHAHGAGEDPRALAREAIGDGRYGAALQSLREAAEAGDRHAAEVAGMMMLYGERLYGAEVSRDPAAAHAMFERAARAGSPLGAYFLCVELRAGTAGAACARQPSLTAAVR